MSVASRAIGARKTGKPKLKGPGPGIWAFLILFQFFGALTVNGEAPVSSHKWDFRNCVMGQDVLDTGQDGGKTASPVNVSTGCLGGGEVRIYFLTHAASFSGPYMLP